MLNTKALNRFTGANYSLEEVADMDSMLFVVLDSLQKGMNPQEAKGKS